MSTHIRTRQSARNTTIAAQAAAGVLILSGAAMGFFGVPLIGGAAGEPQAAGAPAAPEAPADPAPGRSVKAEYAALHDPETVHVMFDQLENRPVPDPEPTAAADPGPQDEPEPAVGVRYVGSIKVGGRNAAFMNIGGVTKLLRPGGAPYEGVRLVRVDGDSVVVSIDDSPEQSIERTARSGSAVSVVVGGAPADQAPTALSDDQPETASFTPDMSRDERRAALLERARRERGRWERDRGNGGGPPN